MGPVHTLTAGAVRLGRTRGVLGLTVALAAVALGGAGCQSAAKSRADMMRAVGLTKPAPPAQLICMVEPGLQELPDTTRSGLPTKALLGRMYLLGTDRKPADADGQLTLMVSDATLRPPGAAARKDEVVNIDPVTLKSLVANDERFGKHYVFVFPWPTDWTDVDQLAIQVRYTPNPALKSPDLFHQVMKVSVDRGGPPAVIDKATGRPLYAAPTESGITRGVPSPNDFLMSGGSSMGGSTTPPIQQAGNFVPPTTTAGPNGSRVTSAAWARPAPGQPIQPAMPTIRPSAFGPQPGLPTMPGNLPPTLPSPPGSGSQPFVWPPPGGVTPPPVGPVGELRPDGALQPVVIQRQ